MEKDQGWCKNCRKHFESGLHGFTSEGCPSENRIFGQMSHFWTKEGLFGQKRRVLGQKCRVLGQKGALWTKVAFSDKINLQMDSLQISCHNWCTQMVSLLDESFHAIDIRSLVTIGAPKWILSWMNPFMQLTSDILSQLVH